MIKALRNGDALWYAPDHDYGSHASVFVPYFAVVQAATITGDRHPGPGEEHRHPALLQHPHREGYTLHIGAPLQTTRAATTWRMPAAPTARLKPPCARRRAVHVAAPPLQDPPQSGRSWLLLMPSRPVDRASPDDRTGWHCAP